MIIYKGLSPCLMFAVEDNSSVSNDKKLSFVGSAASYHDNRHGTMWKLPVFGCTDANQVLHKVVERHTGCPDRYIRMATFNSMKQVEVISDQCLGAEIWWDCRYVQPHLLVGHGIHMSRLKIVRTDWKT